MKTITIKAYTFEELSKEAQEKALEAYRDINVDWFYMDDIYYDIAKEYGLTIHMAEACFDLDRSNYLYFDTHDHGSSKNVAIAVEDYKLFLKKAGVKYRKAVQDEYIKVDTKHYGGGDGKNYLDFEFETAFTTVEEEKLDECLNECLEKILQALEDNYEYHTSDEAVTETIIENEYLFTVDGSRSAVL